MFYYVLFELKHSNNNLFPFAVENLDQQAVSAIQNLQEDLRLSDLKYDPDNRTLLHTATESGNKDMVL